MEKVGYQWKHVWLNHEWICLELISSIRIYITVVVPSQVHISHRNSTCQSHNIIKHLSTHLKLLFNSIGEDEREKVRVYTYLSMLNEQY